MNEDRAALREQLHAAQRRLNQLKDEATALLPEKDETFAERNARFGRELDEVA